MLAISSPASLRDLHDIDVCDQSDSLEPGDLRPSPPHLASSTLCPGVKTDSRWPVVQSLSYPTSTREVA